jgi:hypothetical protein
MVLTFDLQAFWFLSGVLRFVAEMLASQANWRCLIAVAMKLLRESYLSRRQDLTTNNSVSEHDNKDTDTKCHTALLPEY